jgi:Flp pilus assembly secretin CpaC
VITKRILASLAGAFLTLGLLAGSARPTAAADNISVVAVQTGHSIIINAEGLTRVAVGDGRIAGVVPIGTTQLLVNGKAPGHTTLYVWQGSKRTNYEITVTEAVLDDIAKLLRSAIDEPGVEVVAFDYNFIVRGTVPDVEAYRHLSDVIASFKGLKFHGASGGTDAVVVNAVTIARPLGNLQDEIATVPGTHGIRVDSDGKGNVVVSGSVHDRVEAEQVLDKVRGLAGPFLSSDGKVLDRLAVETTSQIDVKVYVLEVDDSASSTLGLSIQSATAGASGSTTLTYNGVQYGVSSTPTFLGLENPANPTQFGKWYDVGSIARVSLLVPTLNLLITDGHAKILSSPNLVTLPGKEATFLVGGEIPIPISNGLGTVTIQYKQYGVQLTVTPTLLGNGGIESVIAPQISSLDYSNGIQLNGFTVPGLKVSQLSTDIVTQSGESIVMGGLVQRLESRTITKIPLLGDLPVLGPLFRSTDYLRQNADVVFVLTPSIVTK